MNLQKFCSNFKKTTERYDARKNFIFLIFKTFMYMHLLYSSKSSGAKAFRAS